MVASDIFYFCKKRMKLHAMIVPGWYVKVTYKVFLGKWFVLKTEEVTLPPMHPNCKCYLSGGQYIRGHHANYIILDD